MTTMKPIKIPLRKSIWWYLRNDEFQMNCTFTLLFLVASLSIYKNVAKYPVLYVAFLPIALAIYFFIENLIRILKK